MRLFLLASDLSADLLSDSYTDSVESLFDETPIVTSLLGQAVPLTWKVGHSFFLISSTHTFQLLNIHTFLLLRFSHML